MAFSAPARREIKDRGRVPLLPGKFLRTLEEDISITPKVLITAERVVGQGPAAEMRRHMLQRIKTKCCSLVQRVRKRSSSCSDG
ncbi:MAG: hypothetical protein EPN47_15625 [Acidobacteria bacterium]|nr:MAG: hypothetical protein EPN47_15625 [Acidobacteriota bacterium]